MTNTTNYQELQRAAAAISSRCDGARELDGVGWNATDTTFGKSLAALPLDQWDDDVAAAAWQVLSHYGRQLKEDGIEVLSLPRVAEALGSRFGRNRAIKAASSTLAAEKVARTTHMELEGDMIVMLDSPYNTDLLADTRAIPGRRWDANQKHWSFPVESSSAVWDMAAKWGIRLSDAVRDLPDSTPEALVPQLGLELDDTRVLLRFERAYEINTDVRSVPGAKWNPSKKAWVTVKANLAQAVKFAQKWDLLIQPGVVEQMEEMERQAAELHAASQALDADVEVKSAIPLLPYQRAGVAYLLRTRRAMLADSMGLGKSVQALAAVVTDGSLPVAVVCPNTLKLNWKAEVEKFFPDLSVTIVSGTKSEDIEDADVIVVNYDIVAQRADDIVRLSPAALIADESHAIKNGKAKYRCPNCHVGCQVNSVHCTSCSERYDKPEETWTVRRTEGVMKIAREIPDEGMVLLLSGTPITNRPAELISQLIAIGRIADFGGRWKFQNRYAPGGTGATNLGELNKLLRERCFIRRTQKDVFAELPDLRNAQQLMPVDPKDMAEYRRIEADVVEHLAQRAKELAEEAGEDATAAYWEKRLRAEAAEHLVRISVLKNAVADLKMKSMIKWIETFLEDSDEKVVVFAEHIELVEKIVSHFGDIAVKIRGGVSQANRMAAVKRFQEDPTCRVFVGNMAAASEGLTLTAASNVVFTELAWTPTMHAQCASRCYARANDMHGATAWYLLAPSTIDMDIFALLAKKELIVNAATNGEEVDKQGSVLGDLLVALAGRGLDAIADADITPTDIRRAMQLDAAAAEIKESLDS